MLKVGTAFAYSRSKTTMRRRFRALFATVPTQKGVFLRKYVTMDETQIHHFTPESNRQAAEWIAAGENRPKQPKTQTSAVKFFGLLI